MAHMEDEIKTIILQRFGSVPKFAEHVHLHPQTVYSALRNGLAGASMATVMPIVAALRIDPLQLQLGRVVPIPDHKRGYVDVPLLGSIAAGTASEAATDASTFPVPAELHDQHPQSFLLKVVGESMNRVLPNGCYALVDPALVEVVPRQLYAVAVGTDKATIKRVQRLANGLQLDPESTDPTFKPQIFDAADPHAEPVHIIGRAVWYCSPLDWGAHII